MSSGRRQPATSNQQPETRKEPALANNEQTPQTEPRERCLLESEVDPNPFKQFQVWFDAAVAECRSEPTAMTLATADREGRPSARLVLLKGCDERGFVFFTNYESEKARDLAENPWASLVFFWCEHQRQVRIDGRVERVSEGESDEYFATRPRGSQIGAWASNQSSPIAGREELERRVAEMEAEYEGRDIPRPSCWGGYRVIPVQFEFWQGRPNRLHDRIRYSPVEEGWRIERVAP
jgi:pyridoxamine 5'-phosphate oxidase